MRNVIPSSLDLPGSSGEGKYPGKSGPGKSRLYVYNTNWEYDVYSAGKAEGQRVHSFCAGTDCEYKRFLKNSNIKV